MGDRNVRTEFTKEEYQRLRELVSQLEKANPDKQKGIRGKLRKMGLYWSEIGAGAYTVRNLDALFQRGTLKIMGQNAPQQTSQKSLHVPSEKKTPGRAASDEAYVIGLCDEVLGQKAERQYRFSFLTGDTGVKLPVDAYYPELHMVVEYHEQQHTEKVAFFDKRETASGVNRGEQRRIYDQRRAEVLPKYGIKLIVIPYSAFGTSKKIQRDHDRDLGVVKNLLKEYIS